LLYRSYFCHEKKLLVATFRLRHFAG